MVLVKKWTKSVQYFLNYELLFEFNDEEISCHDPPRGRNELEQSGPAEASDVLAIKGGGHAARSVANPAHCHALPQLTRYVMYFRQRRDIS